jgi:hypothetical protein
MTRCLRSGELPTLTQSHQTAQRIPTASDGKFLLWRGVLSPPRWGDSPGTKRNQRDRQASYGAPRSRHRRARPRERVASPGHPGGGAAQPPRREARPCLPRCRGPCASGSRASGAREALRRAWLQGGRVGRPLARSVAGTAVGDPLRGAERLPAPPSALPPGPGEGHRPQPFHTENGLTRRNGALTRRGAPCSRCRDPGRSPQARPALPAWLRSSQWVSLWEARWC